MDALAILKNSNNPSTMSARGIDLIELLLQYSSKKTLGRTNDQIPLTKTSASMDGIPRLDLKEIAAYLAADKSASTPTADMPVGGSNMGNNDPDFGDFDLGYLDPWLRYFDLSLVPS